MNFKTAKVNMIISCNEHPDPVKVVEISGLDMIRLEVLPTEQGRKYREGNYPKFWLVETDFDSREYRKYEE